MSVLHNYSSDDGSGESDAKMYSKIEMEHLFARRETRRDLDRLDVEILNINRKVLEANTKQSLESQTLREILSGLPNTLAQQIARCREEIRQEVTMDHPTRLENLEMRNHIENQVKEVDTTLGKQIAGLDRKLSEEIKSSHTVLSEQIQSSNVELKNALKVQWLRITLPVAVVVTIGGILTWVITTGSKLVGHG